MDINLFNFVYEIELNKLTETNTDLIDLPKQEKIKKLDIINEDKLIIKEHVLNKDKLSNLFNIIMQGSFIQFLSNNDIAALLPKNFKITRKLKHLSPGNTLIVFSVPFMKEYLIHACDIIIAKSKVLLNNANFNKDEFKNSVIEIFNDNPKTTAIFMSFKNVYSISCMFLNGIETTEDDFRHEFIHYYQWCTGDDEIQNLNEQIQLPTNINLIINRSSAEIQLEKIYNKKEVIPYINELIDQLNDFEMKRSDFKDFKIKHYLFNINDESDEQYIERMSETEFFKYLKSHKQNLIPFLIYILLEIFEPDFHHELKLIIMSQLQL